MISMRETFAVLSRPVDEYRCNDRKRIGTEFVLFQRINGHAIVGPLFGLYKLQLTDAYLPKSELDSAFALARIDHSQPYYFQGYSVILAVVRPLVQIGRALDDGADPPPLSRTAESNRSACPPRSSLATQGMEHEDKLNFGHYRRPLSSTMNLVRLSNPADFTRLQIMMSKEPSAFLIGSAVSIFPPTDIPAGGTIAQDIVDFLLEGQVWGDAEERSIARRFALSCAFESLLEHYPKIGNIKSYFAQVMSGKLPNQVHAAIITASAKGGSPIITPNYDDLLERAGQAAAIAHFVVIEESDKAHANCSAVPIFKIHGCVTRPNSLVVRMTEEPISDNWKSAYLIDLIRGRNLFIVGYSGLDFDICPLLLGANIRRIVWVVRDFPSDSLSQHLKAMVNNSTLGDSLIVAAGDLQSLFGLTPLARAPSGFSLSSFLRNDLSANEAALWRANFFAFIGIEPAVRRLFPLLRPDDVERLAASCDFMRGNHKRSFDRYTGVRVSKDEARLLKSIRLRNSGRLLTARVHLSLFAASWRHQMLTTRRSTVRQLRYSLVLNRFRPGSHTWCRHVKRLLQSALASGAWSEVVQLLAMLQQFGVNRADIGFTWNILPPSAGAAHIGGASSYVHEFARAAFRADHDYATFEPVIDLARKLNYGNAMMLLYDAALCSTAVVGTRLRWTLFSNLLRTYAKSELTWPTKIIYSAKAFAILLRLYRHVPV